MAETSMEESLEYASGLLERTAWELEQEKAENKRLRAQVAELCGYDSVEEMDAVVADGREA